MDRMLHLVESKVDGLDNSLHDELIVEGFGHGMNDLMMALL